MARTQSQQGVPTPRVMCVPAADPGDGMPEAGSGRMVRSGAAFRLGRLLVLGGLLVVGWVLGVFLGWAGAAPADAQAHVSVPHTAVNLPAGVHDAAGVASTEGAEGSARSGGFTAGHISARAGGSMDAERAGIQAQSGDRRNADDHALRRDVADGAPAGAAAAGIASTTVASTTAEAMAGRGVDGLTSQSTPVLPAPSTVEHTAGASGLAPQPGGGSGPFGPGFGDVVRSIDDPRLMVLPAPLAAVLPPVVRTAADDPSFSPD